MDIDHHPEYSAEALLEATAGDDPWQLFDLWYQQVRTRDTDGNSTHNAITLATVTPDGAPNARIVLLQHYDRDGFCFYSNYESVKGRELAADPRACLLYFDPTAHRQIRMNGTVDRLSAAASDAYFKGRPRGNQLAAWASAQSRETTIEALQAAADDAETRFADGAIPRPPHWGGYRFTPSRYEFWQGRPSRLHDRLIYELDTHGIWNRYRLAP